MRYVEEMSQRIHQDVMGVVQNCQHELTRCDWSKDKKLQGRALKLVHDYSESLERVFEDWVIPHVKVVRILNQRCDLTRQSLNVMQLFRKYGLFKAILKMYPSTRPMPISKEDNPYSKYFTGNPDEDPAQLPGLGRIVRRAGNPEQKIVFGNKRPVGEKDALLNDIKKRAVDEAIRQAKVGADMVMGEKVHGHQVFVDVKGKFVIAADGRKIRI